MHKLDSRCTAHKSSFISYKQAEQTNKALNWSMWTLCCWPLRTLPSLPGTAPARYWRSWCPRTRTGGRTPALRTRTGSETPSESGQCASPPGCPQCSGKQHKSCCIHVVQRSEGHALEPTLLLTRLFCIHKVLGKGHIFYLAVPQEKVLLYQGQRVTTLQITQSQAKALNL